MLSLAKATILWNLSVKIHRYMICGVVATSISDCGVVYCVLCSVRQGTAIKKCISTLMYTVWHVDIYKITFKLVINWTNEIL